MRQLSITSAFNGILSWDSYFHLTQREQRDAIGQFAAHLKPNGALLLTIGHEAGEVTGMVEGEEVYHASLAPNEYQKILEQFGFTQITIELEDANCGHHSILLAKKGPDK